MNPGLTRLIKSFYRREPAVALVVTAGTVDIALGGLSEHWSLLAFGLGAIGLTLALRWRLGQHPGLAEVRQKPVLLLPEQSSRPSLPNLSRARKQPPQS